MLLVTESAPSNQRGYYGAFAQAGVPVGVILANLAFIITGALVSEEAFFSWGWRIPFLASAILIGISMYIQLNLEDTKAFKELQASRQTGNAVKITRSPIIEAITKYPTKIASSCWSIPFNTSNVLYIDSILISIRCSKC